MRPSESVHVSLPVTIMGPLTKNTVCVRSLPAASSLDFASTNDWYGVAGVAPSRCPEGTEVVESMKMYALSTRFGACFSSTKPGALTSK